MPRRRDAVNPPELVEQLAAAAHALWRDRRLGEGWTVGDEYDADAQIDPCLCPFDELPEFEKDQLIDRDGWHNEIEDLIERVDFNMRYGSAELRLEEARIGARVRLTPGPGQQDDPEAWIGEIVDVTPSERNSGRLMSIGVRWQDETEEQYLPHELMVIDDGE